MKGERGKIGDGKIRRGKNGGGKIREEKIGREKIGARKLRREKIGARKLGREKIGARKLRREKIGTEKIRTRKFRTGKESETEKGAGQDYGVYVLSGRERLTYLAFYLCLDGIVSNLFFHSWHAFLLLLPGLPFFFRDRRKALGERRREEMQVQFLTAMQMVSASLQAGYAVENAFREALKELEKIYDSDSFIILELRFLVSQIGLNRTAEALLMDLGKRSHVEDIRNFAEVFYTAKRTGGDLMAIIQNTVSAIQEKQETRREIETCLSGKVMEQNMMSVIPLFILGYVKLTSPGFLDVLYHNAAGVTIMIICLALYGTAYFWGRKIIHIQV